MRRLLVLLLTCSAVAAAAPVPPAAYQELRWRMIGPFRGGRTRAAAGVTGQPNVFYMAPVDGGVWKTENAGRTWRPIFDAQPTQSIGSLAVAPSDPNIIYAGSGEGLHRPDLSVGDGVYKSTDAGATWTHTGLADAQQIPRLAVDPRRPERVFAAVLGHPYGPSEQRGVFRSLDGGRSWQKVLFKDANTGASDIEIDPRNPDVVYAALWEARLGPTEDDNDFEGAGGGLYKSTDGGTTWKQLAGGLPANGVQFDLAIAPSRPSRLYVTLSTLEKGHYASGQGNGLYRSDDAGASWTRITTDERALMKIGGGDLMVPVVDPKDPDLLYIASIVAMVSRDGGKTFTWLRGAPGGDDYQNFWINPTDPRSFLLVSDQGACVTVDGGATWSSWYNQPTAQLYRLGVSSDVPYKVCSGQQESGSVCIASRGADGGIGARDWHPVGAIEYGIVVPDPRDRDVVYGAGRNAVSRFRWSTGQAQDVTPIPVRDGHRVDRTQPLVFSPVQPSILYYAAERVYETADGGQTWRAISGDLAHPDPGVPPSVGTHWVTEPGDRPRGVVYALAPSHKTIATLWAGTDDGKLWVTRDRGAHWADITPAAVTPWSKVTQLEASHFDDASAYASISRLRVDDLHPFIYRTHDGGKTWAPIVGGLPDEPVNAVREDPVRRGLLYASTERGVYASFDDGAQWQALQHNLPHTSVRDLVVHGDDLIVATHGRGFWIMDDVALLRQLGDLSRDALFAPAPAYRFPRNTYPDTPVPPDEPMAENPPSGAIIDYYLAQPGPVTLEILDARGAVIRRYASSDPPEQTAADLATQLIPAIWVAPHRPLPTTAGMHRHVWDLHGERPLANAYQYPITATPHATPRTPEGPLAPPGTYTARLVANGKRLTQAFEVRVDPRVGLPRAAVLAQGQLEQRLAALLTRSSTDVLAARSVLEQLAKLPPGPAVAHAVAAVTAILEGPKAHTATRAPTLGSVNGALASLYGQIQVDAAPTAAQRAETAKAEQQLGELTTRWKQVLDAELAALRAAGAPAIHPELRPVLRATEGDEE